MSLIQKPTPEVSTIGKVLTTDGYVISNAAGSADITKVDDFVDENFKFFLSIIGQGFAEGSALKIEGITVSAGSTFSFDFDFLTVEGSKGSNVVSNDSFLLYVEREDGTSETITVASVVKNSADFEKNNADGLKARVSSLNNQNFSYTFDTAGTYEVTLLVLDHKAFGGNTIVSVDNFQVDGEALLPEESSPNGGDPLLPEEPSPITIVDEGILPKEPSPNGIGDPLLPEEPSPITIVDEGILPEEPSPNGIGDPLLPEEPSPITIVDEGILPEEPSLIGIGDASWYGEFDEISPTEGDSQYLITNGLGSVSAQELKAFAPGIDLTVTGEDAKEFLGGSAVSLDLIVTETNQELIFDYNFLVMWDWPDYLGYTFQLNDHFVMHVESADGTVSETVTLFSRFENNEDLVAKPTKNAAMQGGNFHFHTGYQEGSYTFSTAGTYDITFAVLTNHNMLEYESGVLIDNIRIGDAISPEQLPPVAEEEEWTWTPIGIGDASFYGEFDGISPAKGDSQYAITTYLGSKTASEVKNFSIKDNIVAGTGIDLTPTEEYAKEFINGSGVSFDIVVEANQQLIFDYNFLTNEYPGELFYNDSLLLHVESADGTIFETVTLASVVQNGEDLVAKQTGDFQCHTGYQQGSYTFSTAGTYDITFAVFNAGDEILDSAALLDNIQLI